MKLVVGLGNPGLKYKNTRHNVGFQHDASQPHVKFDAEIVELVVASEKVLLAAPQTFMNVSGRSVGRIVDFYQLPLEDLIVVCDDINLEIARLRLRASGSDGGQKGLRNIIERLGSQEFARLRIGVGRPPGRWNAADYVLSRFRRAEVEPMEDAILRAADGVEAWLRDGLQKTMNQINAPQEN